MRRVIISTALSISCLAGIFVFSNVQDASADALSETVAVPPPPELEVATGKHAEDAADTADIAAKQAVHQSSSAPVTTDQAPATVAANSGSLVQTFTLEDMSDAQIQQISLPGHMIVCREKNVIFIIPTTPSSPAAQKIVDAVRNAKPGEQNITVNLIGSISPQYQPHFPKLQSVQIPVGPAKGFVVLMNSKEVGEQQLIGMGSTEEQAAQFRQLTGGCFTGIVFTGDGQFDALAEPARDMGKISAVHTLIEQTQAKTTKTQERTKAKLAKLGAEKITAEMDRITSERQRIQSEREALETEEFKATQAALEEQRATVAAVEKKCSDLENSKKQKESALTAERNAAKKRALQTELNTITQNLTAAQSELAKEKEKLAAMEKDVAPTLEKIKKLDEEESKLAAEEDKIKQDPNYAEVQRAEKKAKEQEEEMKKTFGLELDKILTGKTDGAVKGPDLSVD